MQSSSVFFFICVNLDITKVGDLWCRNADVSRIQGMMCHVIYIFFGSSLGKV